MDTAEEHYRRALRKNTQHHFDVLLVFLFRLQNLSYCVTSAEIMSSTSSLTLGANLPKPNAERSS